MKILILGGYGVFGGRLAELLADMSSLEILVCGRSRARAEAFCTAWRGQAQLRPLMLDRRDIADALRIHKPDLVVDASGPFQTYGSACYGVITACIDAGIDYLDFADAADFVFGVSQFDERAKAAGVFVLSGVSSFPVLTAAVLREMERTMDILAVEGGIAPSPYAGIGLNVMRAVVGYAGAPVKLWRHGGPSHGVGLAESRRFTVAVPGRLPLRNIHFSLVDVPDLQVIPPEHPSMTDIWMGAGPVPEFLHRMLNLLAKARARFGLPSFAPLSPLFHAVLNRMRFGEHRGGMFVRAQGRAAGRPMEMSWHLLAEGDDGPYIPSMAIEAIVRKMLSGERPLPGARAGTDALNLADYDRLFRSKTIYTGFRREEPDVPLFRQLLGPAFDDLPPRLRELHDSKDPRQWSGVAEIRRGQGMLARMISALVGFPQAGKQIPVSVTFTPEKGKERWTRNFGGRRFSSRQSAGRSKDQYLLAERFGVVTVALALVLDGGRLALIPRRWHLLGVPLPGFLLPKGQSFEFEKNGRFHFDVEISLPFIGLVVAYKGTLEPAAGSVDHRGPGETPCGASPGEEA
ncbi:DUF4166 domain-containing protein [Agrobacterium tumefaciens]|uniref:Saccharopine dehydrogenase n=1 Tax=Agrobacterium tumefaciens TaxID=358 RepID=A0A2L2L9R1_AGRTU|nr:SDR family oxidoreductase [Agrobacterium tumefaciens]AVH41084.1 saccharopine dehydrogenase [Agrobacterium tumefaciens]NSY95026.1 DUF4166 domain-containing protein [Agrobacterium tumefaciens]NSZ01785.1 DUF4166 domain-containing protein [Agrobacterium tumefaciens]NSZ38828.1 DUF4166 domain-containing protein [Agrobacterium tumefaciens]NTB01543.1 DUF4166 domain-containing protein [Agrobacterium tumefaciens]